LITIILSYTVSKLVHFFETQCRTVLKSQSEGCPRIGDAHPDVLVIPGYAPWKQISNL